MVFYSTNKQIYTMKNLSKEALAIKYEQTLESIS